MEADEVEDKHGRMVDRAAWCQQGGTEVPNVSQDCSAALGPEGIFVTCSNVSLWLGLFLAWAALREDHTPVLNLSPIDL